MMNHNDFPKMTEEFDRSVRKALDSLPERESKPVRRFSAKKIVCAGLAAALCIGGTAFAANAQSWFPLLFPNGGDANLEGYVQTADNAKLTDENEHYRLSVESVLFDESAGTGVISLHLENKKQDGVKPFTLAHLIDSYRNKPDITWSTLSSCYAEEGQLDFEVMYGDSGFCGSEFYLDTARSTDNDYYFEGAFAISSDYRQGEPLRLEALEPGKTTVRADGAGTAKTVLAVDLPEFQQMPYLTSENGDVTRSEPPHGKRQLCIDFRQYAKPALVQCVRVHRRNLEDFLIPCNRRFTGGTDKLRVQHRISGITQAVNLRLLSVAQKRKLVGFQQNRRQVVLQLLSHDAPPIVLSRGISSAASSMFLVSPLTVVPSTSTTQSAVSRCVSICEIRTTVVSLSAQFLRSSSRYALAALTSCDLPLSQLHPAAKVTFAATVRSA